MICNTCASPLKTIAYQSGTNWSLTTMNTRVEGETRVWFCDQCTHLQTESLFDDSAYYAEVYDINSRDDEDDQLYTIVDGKPVYRADHQLAVLRARMPANTSLRILDFGCAKGATMKKLVAENDKLMPFLFDVTDRYVPFWQRFERLQEYAIHDLPAHWASSMDVVVSFFALEHATRINDALAQIHFALKDGGLLHFVVPNTYTNIADLTVADHPNHFSALSLRYCLQRNGFRDIEIDDQVHNGAFTIAARKGDAAITDADPAEVLAIRDAALSLGEFWRNVGSRLKAFEEALPTDATLAIYGAGFYATYLTSLLRAPERVVQYIDRNQHLQGRSLLGKPIVAPADAAKDVDHLIVALNPRIARQAVTEAGSPTLDSATKHFL